jgi:hypothetical protein
MTTPKPTPIDRLESLVLVAIVILVGTAAGAASFTHVHDWTMANSPQQTPGWFGWANAVISELVPTASLLTIRRRKRTGAPITYPMAMLIAAAGLSLAAQLAVAKPGFSGWLLSAVPALAFMALVKLVLAPIHHTTSQHTTSQHTTTAPATTAPPGDTPAHTSRPTTIHNDHTPVTTPAAIDVDQVPATSAESTPQPHVPAHLLPTARFAAVNHEQTTGRPITADELATRMTIAPAIAGQLLATINPPARINGTPVSTGVVA